MIKFSDLGTWKLSLALLVGIAVGGTAISQTVTQKIPDDLHLIVGKHVIVGRIPLCVPKTYTVNLSYSGKTATVISFTTNPAMAKLTPSVEAIMTPGTRANVEDAARGGILLFEFKDGTQLDTCGNLMASQLIPSIELAPGETITASESAVGSTPAQTSPASSGAPQQCPVTVTSVTSGVNFLHAFLEALTTSEFQRQIDSATHEGHTKHYLDMRMRNDSAKSIHAFEMVAIYSNKMGDETSAATFVSQNSDAIKPGDEYSASAMDRSEWTQNGAGEVKLYISRVRFEDGTFWQDDGSRSCSQSNAAN